jgi:ABC-type nickel/cobalt efflux system permease component RcnA
VQWLGARAALLDDNTQFSSNATAVGIIVRIAGMMPAPLLDWILNLHKNCIEDQKASILLVCQMRFMTPMAIYRTGQKPGPNSSFRKVNNHTHTQASKQARKHASTTHTHNTHEHTHTHNTTHTHTPHAHTHTHNTHERLKSRNATSYACSLTATRRCRGREKGAATTPIKHTAQ